MVTLSTRIDEINAVEEFKITVVDGDGVTFPIMAHGVLERYSFKAKLSDEKTVGDWKRLRFSPTDEAFSCKVLYGTGKVSKDNEDLKSVRDSYV